MMSFYLLFMNINNYHDLVLVIYTKITFKEREIEIVVPNKERMVLLHSGIKWTKTYMKQSLYHGKSEDGVADHGKEACSSSLPAK